MDREKAIRKVESCLTDYFPMEDFRCEKNL